MTHNDECRAKPAYATYKRKLEDDADKETELTVALIRGEREHQSDKRYLMTLVCSAAAEKSWYFWGCGKHHALK
jgi:hypothetical protein